MHSFQLKIERAKKHVADLEREHRAFLDTQPYRIGTKNDPETGNLIYYVTSADPVPDCLPLIAGDIIQNLMTALDHLAYRIVWSDTKGKPPNPNWIYFPIQDTAEKYEAKKRRKMEGALQDTFQAIDALKPYEGGNELLWQLYRLNNLDKHRLLLTVGSQAAGIRLGDIMARDMVASGVPAKFIAAVQSVDVLLLPLDKGFPLKEGFVLMIDAIHKEPDPNQKFAFIVALYEPGIIEGQALIPVLHQLAALVESIVETLTPLLK